MAFDRRHSIIVGYHLFKSVPLSNIFFIGGETVDDFDFVRVFSLLCLFFQCLMFFFLLF